MLRVNLASNNNRSLLKIVMVPTRADLKKLTSLAKDKLRLKGVNGFYKIGGDEVMSGENLHEDMLLLVHRGEAFVGKSTDSISAAHALEPLVLAPAVDSSFERSWLRRDPPDPQARQLRILTFNILAPCLAQGTTVDESEEATRAAPADPQWEPAEVRGYGVHSAPKPPGLKQLSHNFRCDQSLLSWEYRFPRLQTELLKHRPDLICLQELDSTAWEDIQRVLQGNGYSSGVCGKAKGGANNFVAMFWRKERLRAQGEPEIVYLKTQGTIMAIVQRLQLLPKSAVHCVCCTGQGRDAFGVCPLCDGVGHFKEEEDEAGSFLAVTTHLKAGLKEKDEVDRAKQADDLLAVLGNLAGPSEGIVFTGDLNSHIDALPFLGAACEARQPLPSLVIPRLTSANFHCAVSEVTGGKPLAFSQWCRRCDVEIRSVIDHILLRGPQLTSVGMLAAPAEAAVVAAGCLPNAAHPSDHIPVVVDVCFSEIAATAPNPVRTSKSSSTMQILHLDAVPSGVVSDKDVLLQVQELPLDGRVAVTEDGFKYVALPKEWQAHRDHLARTAAAYFTHCKEKQLATDRAALERQLARRHSSRCQEPGPGELNWGFWSPQSCVGLHISLGKHADNVNVGKRVRFQVKKLLHFVTRKLGEPSSSEPSLYGARWFTFEVKLIDEVRYEGEEPHISFAVFGAHQILA